MSDGAHVGAVAIDGPRRTLISLSLTAATLMQTLDNTIANVALPRMQGSFSATQDQMAWVLTSYIIASAIMIPLSGWLAGQIGRKRVFLFSVAGFTIASMLCGLAQSLPQIVLARVLQGVSGAALVPLSQAALLDITPPAHQARAMSMWAMATSLGPIMGPALGGWLTENYNWRWVFFINVPIGILAFLGMASSLPRTTTVRKSRFDFFGFTALSVGLGALQLMLDRGQIKDWFGSTEIWIEAAITLLAFYLFVVHMLTTTGQRFINPALFKDRNFVAGSVVFFVVGVVMFATLALLPTMLENLMNYPVLTTGLRHGTARGWLRACAPCDPSADEQFRSPADRGRRIRAHSRGCVADDRLRSADGDIDHHLVGLCAGRGRQPRLLARGFTGICDPDASSAQ